MAGMNFQTGSKGLNVRKTQINTVTKDKDISGSYTNEKNIYEIKI
ncbi:hypothetical protein [uncultured Robinsoniella sp.]